MCSAKGEAVVQQNPAICDVHALNAYGKAFAEALAEREVERGVRLKVIAGNGWVAIREARGVVNVGRGIAPPGQRVLSADMQRVSLIVVQQFETVAKGEIGETAVDVSESEGKLI